MEQIDIKKNIIHHRVFNNIVDISFSLSKLPVISERSASAFIPKM